MAKRWTVDDLRVMPVSERANLYRSAGRLAHTAEGAALKKLIEEAGLPYSDSKALTLDDPLAVRMWEIINSDEGKRLAIEGTKKGLPALALIDPLLQEALGIDYGAHNHATNRAGIMVGDLMMSMGYRQIRVKKMPPGSVAKTAATWG